MATLTNKKPHRLVKIIKNTLFNQMLNTLALLDSTSNNTVNVDIQNANYVDTCNLTVNAR